MSKRRRVCVSCLAYGQTTPYSETLGFSTTCWPAAQYIRRTGKPFSYKGLLPSAALMATLRELKDRHTMWPARGHHRAMASTLACILLLCDANFLAKPFARAREDPLRELGSSERRKLLRLSHDGAAFGAVGVCLCWCSGVTSPNVLPASPSPHHRMHAHASGLPLECLANQAIRRELRLADSLGSTTQSLNAEGHHETKSYAEKGIECHAAYHDGML
jgi:hypothetical protein